MSATGNGENPPPLPMKKGKSQPTQSSTTAVSSEDVSSDYDTPCDNRVTLTTSADSDHQYSHLQREGMSRNNQLKVEKKETPIINMYSQIVLPPTADESSDGDLPSEWMSGREKPPALPQKMKQNDHTDPHELPTRHLELVSSRSSRPTHGYEQFAVSTKPSSQLLSNNYEQFAVSTETSSSGKPTSEERKLPLLPPSSLLGRGGEVGELKRCPSLEWDSNDVPPPIPPKPANLSTDPLDTSTLPLSVQNRWEKDRMASRQGRQYDTIKIPFVQKKWIADHDRHRQVQGRSYEEVDGVNWNFRNHQSPSDGGDLDPDHLLHQPPGLRLSLGAPPEADEPALPGEGAEQALPDGWEVDIQQGQTVYWHVATGKVQTKRPTGTESASTTYSVDDSKEDVKAIQEMVARKQGHRSIGSYLGWLDVPAHDLVSGSLVPAAQRSIAHVLRGRNVDMDKNGEDRIEGGQDVCLEIKGGELHLFNLKTMSRIRKQLLKDIKVFAIGRDNERDLGYISHHADVNSCKCHVFRLKGPAQNFVGSVLSQAKNNQALSSQGWEETVKETLHETRLRHLSSHSGASESSHSARDHTPSSLDGQDPELDEDDFNLISNPTAEALVDQEFNGYEYKRFECTYMGSINVLEAFGQQMVFEALSKLVQDQSSWMDIYCDISPQCVRLLDKDAGGMVVSEHRVRFISFLGFGPSSKVCGFVVDRGGENFQCYGFYSEPSCDQLCLQLHLACQERFERVLQAHPEASEVAESLKKDNKPQSWINRIWRRSYQPEGASGGVVSREGEGQRFVVHYLGYQQIATSNDSDITLAVIESLAASSPSHLATVQLEVLPAGLSFYDSNKILFKRKTYAAKDISYLLGKDKHFAFVCDETTGTRVVHKCHVIKTGEFEVDVKTVVQTIKSTLL